MAFIQGSHIKNDSKYYCTAAASAFDSESHSTCNWSMKMVRFAHMKTSLCNAASLPVYCDQYIWAFWVKLNSVLGDLQDYTVIISADMMPSLIPPLISQPPLLQTPEQLRPSPVSLIDRYRAENPSVLFLFRLAQGNQKTVLEHNASSY